MATRSIEVPSDSIPYVQLQQSGTDQVWNRATSAVITYVNTNTGLRNSLLTTAAVATGSTQFVYTVPSTLPAGAWIEVVRNCAGGSPATSNADLTDVLLPVGEAFTWTGTTATPTSNIEGFHTERIFRIWVEDHLPLQVVPEADISEMILCNGGTAESGVPRFISFDEFGTGTLYPTPDDAYTIKMTWWPPLVNFTPGDTSSDTANIVVNLPGDLAEAVVRSRGVVDLQRNQPQQLKEGVIQGLMAEYNQLVIANRGAGNAGARSIRRKSIDQIRAERWR